MDKFVFLQHTLHKSKFQVDKDLNVKGKHKSFWKTILANIFVTMHKGTMYFLKHYTGSTNHKGKMNKLTHKKSR